MQAHRPDAAARDLVYLLLPSLHLVARPSQRIAAGQLDGWTTGSELWPGQDAKFLREPSGRGERELQAWGCVQQGSLAQLLSFQLRHSLKEGAAVRVSASRG